MSKTGKWPAPALLIITLCMPLLSGCHPKPVTDFYYLVSKQTFPSQATTMNLTIVRRYEKEIWCKDGGKLMEKDGFTTQCLYNERSYDPALNGETTGKWYILHRIDKILSVAMIFEFNHPPPDEVILAQLKKIAPHPVKMAALFHAPAEALIFSPAGDIRYQEKLKPN